jgi:sialic acid synthase SpsE
MRIGALDTDQAVIVVAEIGNNHEGNFAAAEQLIDLAARAGADAVKFQTARAELFISPADEARRARFKSYEFSDAQWRQLAAHARARQLAFLSTPLDLSSLATLTPLVDALKIASGDVTFVPLLDAAAHTRLPLVVSSGAATLAEIAGAVERIRARWREIGHRGELAVLHCVSAYPTPAAEAQLRAILALADSLDVTIGYSDHVLGVEAAAAAVAIGARMVEKHFTVDKSSSSFRDHQLSADPAELAELVRRIRAVEPMLGTAEKRIQCAEEANRDAIRRSVAAATDLPAGHVLLPTDFIWTRPGTGLPPGEEHRLVGCTLNKPLRAGMPIAAADVTS